MRINWVTVNKFRLVSLLFLLVSLPIVLWASGQPQLFTKKAQESEQSSTASIFNTNQSGDSSVIKVTDGTTGFEYTLNNPGEEKIAYAGDRLLVKLKKEIDQTVRERLLTGVNQPLTETGVAQLDQIIQTQKISGIRPLISSSLVERNQAETISQWYIFSFDGPEVIEAPAGDSPINLQQGLFPGLNTIRNLEAELRQEGSIIEEVSFDHQVTTYEVPDDPLYHQMDLFGRFPSLWGHYKIDIDSIWETITGSEILVAVVDTGVDYNHEDLAANMARDGTGEIIGFDFTNSVDGNGDGDYDDPEDVIDTDPMDDNGHGTHVAGTIGAVGDNGVDMVGLNWRVKIMPLKILNAKGKGSLSKGVHALVFAVDRGAKVVSNSWGCEACGFSAVYYDVLNDLTTEQQAVFVFAAGNNGSSALWNSPANDPRVITVGASTLSLGSNDVLNPEIELASFSSTGKKVDLLAPGANILSLEAGTDDLMYANGTSMATPHVSGVAALILAQRDDLSSEQVRQLLRQSATSEVGYRHLNVSSLFSLPDPPIVKLRGISLPGDSKTYPGFVNVGGTISFFGEAGPDSSNPESFSSWALWYITSSGEKTKITSSTTPVDGLLGTLDTGNLPEEDISVELVVTGNDNQEYSSELHRITIDNIVGKLEKPDAIEERNEMVTMRGVAYSPDSSIFGHYTVEYAVGNEPFSWSTSGVTLSNNNGSEAQQEVGTLATIDKRGLAEDIYTVRLTIFSSLGNREVFSQRFRVDRDISQGWPKTLSNTFYSNLTFPPVITDMNNDGSAEVIYLTVPHTIRRNDESVLVHAWDKEGNYVLGYPKEFLYPDGVNNGIFLPGYAIDNVTGDSTKEIVFSVSAYGKTYIQVIDFLTDATWRKDTSDLFSFLGPPTLANLVGGHHKELLVLGGKDTSRIATFEFTEDINLYWQREFDQASNEFSPSNPLILVADDIDEDGTNEIIKSFPYPDNNQTKVFILQSDGSDYPGWPMEFEDAYKGIPAFVADVRPSGQKEVVLVREIPGAQDNHEILTIDPLTKEVLSQYGPFRQNIGGTPPSEPMLFGDYNGDGLLNIIFEEFRHFGTEDLYLIKILHTTRPADFIEILLPELPSISQLTLAGTSGQQSLIGMRASGNTNRQTTSTMNFFSPGINWSKQLDDSIYEFMFNTPIAYQFEDEDTFTVAGVGNYVTYAGGEKSYTTVYLWNTSLPGVESEQSTWPEVWHDSARTNTLPLPQVVTCNETLFINNHTNLSETTLPPCSIQEVENCQLGSYGHGNWGYYPNTNVGSVLVEDSSCTIPHQPVKPKNCLWDTQTRGAWCTRENRSTASWQEWNADLLSDEYFNWSDQLGACTQGSGGDTWEDPSWCGELPTVEPRTESIPLLSSWNLISFQLTPVDQDGNQITSVADILSSIEGQYLVVQGFDQGAQSYYPDLPPEVNTLQTLDPLHGYWIKMNQTATLTITGIPTTQTQVQLRQGWNMVGYLRGTSQPRDEFLSSIINKLETILTYDASDQADPFKDYYPNDPDYANDLSEFRPHLGYWINVSQDVTLELGD